MFVYFDVSLYDQRKFGSLIWEPMHYIKYSANGNLKVIATDALIPGVLKSRMVRLLLTRKADKFEIIATPPLSGRKLEPLPEDPEYVLQEFKELWHALSFSQTTTDSSGSVSGTDMLKWQLGRMGGFPILGRKFEFEISQHLGLTISNNTFKSLLENVLAIGPTTDLKVLERRIIYYPLTVYLEEKSPVRDAVNHFRTDLIYSRCIMSDSRAKRIFEDALSSSTAGI